MNCKTTKLRDAISFALAVGAISTAATGVAFAQDQAQATTLDRIEVTGSRIRQVDVENAAPVLTISRADIEKQGFQSVADILQNISAVGAPAISRAQPLRPVFLAGAGLASALWFAALGYGARLLTPMFARPAAWRVLDVGVAALMFGLAWGLLRPRSVDMDLIAAGACQTSAGARFGLKPQPAPKLAQCQQLVATRTAQSAP